MNQSYNTVTYITWSDGIIKKIPLIKDANYHVMDT